VPRDETVEIRNLWLTRSAQVYSPQAGLLDLFSLAETVKTRLGNSEFKNTRREVFQQKRGIFALKQNSIFINQFWR
jgi:hypothetical protein